MFCSISRAMPSRSRLAGTPSRRTWAASRISDQAVDRISSATRTDRIGSIGVQPVARMTSAAAIAAADPSRSPSTCRIAPRMLRLSRSPPCSTKKPGDIDQQPQARDDQHGTAEHRRGRQKALPRFIDDPQRDDEDGEPVGVGDKRLDATEPIGEAAGGRPVGKMKRIPGETERDRVGKHVAGIRQQRQRTGEHAAGSLGDHEAAGQAGSDQDAFLVRRTMRMSGMAMRGMVMRAVVVIVVVSQSPKSFRRRIRRENPRAGASAGPHCRNWQARAKPHKPVSAPAIPCR